MAAGANITITAKLAQAVGRVGTHYPDSAVTISYDDSRPEELWEVTAETPHSEGVHTAAFIVNDETGEVT